MDKQKILSLVEEKEYKKAKELIIDELNNSEKDIELIKLLGLCNINLNCFDDALNNFEDFLKQNPEDALALYYLATIYLEKEQSEKAESLLKKVIELREDYLDAYKTLAVSLMKQKKSKEVLEYETKMLEIGSEDVQVFEILSTVALEETKFTSAINYLEKALEIEPDNSRLYNKLGLTYFTAGNVQKSIELYSKALELTPDDSSILYNIGLAYFSIELFQESYLYLKKASEIVVKEQYLNAYAMAALKSMHYQDAILLYEDLVKKNSDKENLQYN